MFGADMTKKNIRNTWRLNLILIIPWLFKAWGETRENK